MSQEAPASVSPEFTAPPPDPIGLVRHWLDEARAQMVREPGALALATADTEGRASNRIVQVLDVRDSGLVFSSHSGSLKGRQLAQTNWSSGVMYWRETNRQIIVTWPTHP